MPSPAIVARFESGSLVTLHWDSSVSAYRANVDGPPMYMVSEPLMKAAPALLAACEAAEGLLARQLDEYNSALSVMPRPIAEPGPILLSLRAAIQLAKEPA